MAFASFDHEENVWIDDEGCDWPPVNPSIFPMWSTYTDSKNFNYARKATVKMTVSGLPDFYLLNVGGTSGYNFGNGIFEICSYKRAKRGYQKSTRTAVKPKQTFTYTFYGYYTFTYTSPQTTKKYYDYKNTYQTYVRNEIGQTRYNRQHTYRSYRGTFATTGFSNFNRKLKDQFNVVRMKDYLKPYCVYRTGFTTCGSGCWDTSNTNRQKTRLYRRVIPTPYTGSLTFNSNFTSYGANCSSLRIDSQFQYVSVSGDGGEFSILRSHRYENEQLTCHNNPDRLVYKSYQLGTMFQHPFHTQTISMSVDTVANPVTGWPTSCDSSFTVEITLEKGAKW